MTYIEQFEADLRKKLEEGEKADAIVKWGCERIIESYSNGVSVGRKRRWARKGSKSQKEASAEIQGVNP